MRQECLTEQAGNNRQGVKWNTVRRLPVRVSRMGVRRQQEGGQGPALLFLSGRLLDGGGRGILVSKNV